MELVHNADDIDTLKQLILNGAYLNYQTSNGWCLLFELSIRGQDESIAYFARKGMNLNLRDVKGRSVLYWAICTEQTNVVKKLMQLNYNMREEVYPFLTAQEYAQHKGCKDVLRYL